MNVASGFRSVDGKILVNGVGQAVIFLSVIGCDYIENIEITMDQKWLQIFPGDFKLWASWNGTYRNINLKI